MFCSNCGNKLADGSNFCPKCGNKVGKVSEEKQAKQTISSDSIPEAAKVYLEQGNKYFEIQDFKKAYDAYKAAVQIVPDFFEAHKKIAQICIFNQDKKQALKILDDVISKNPTDHEAFYLRGKVNFLLGKIDKALMDLDISLKFNPGSLDIYKAIISAYKTKENYEQVIENTNEAMKIAPNDCFLYFSRGEAYYWSKSIDKALDDYNKVLEIDPNNIEGLFYRGTILFEKEEYDKSLADINHILEASPNDDNGLILRSKIYFGKKDYQKALSDVDLYIKKIEDLYQKDGPLELYLYQAEVRYKSGWYETNPDSIMEDYLKLWNLETDDEDEYKEKRAKKLVLFKDIMLDRYKKAVSNYNQEKDLFLIYNYKTSDTTKKIYNNISILLSTVIKPQVYSKEPMIFFNKSFADDYCNLIKLCTNKYNDHGRFISHKNDNSKIEPQYWVIIHAYTGLVYRRNESLKWLSIYGEDKAKYKYNSLEDALEDYEKIIRDKHLCNTYNDYDKIAYKTFSWKIGVGEKIYENNFMDIFIVGST